MSPLLKAIKAELPKQSWSVDWSEANEILAEMSAGEIEDFVRELIDYIPNMPVSKKEISYNSPNPAEILGYFFKENEKLHDVLSEEIISELIEAMIDEPNFHVESFNGFKNLKNLTIEHIQDLIDYIPAKEGEDYRSDKRAGLLENPNVTQEFIDSLTSERYMKYFDTIAQISKNPETLYKICLILSRHSEDDNYYAMNYAVNSSCMTKEVLERIAELGNRPAGYVIECRKCTKALIGKIAKTATGQLAETILRRGKTPPEIIEALVDRIDDPDVLMGIAHNRSKKVPPSALLKAFSKIPDEARWYRERFFKRLDFCKAVGDLVREKTGIVPVPPKEEDEEEQPASPQEEDDEEGQVVL